MSTVRRVAGRIRDQSAGALVLELTLLVVGVLLALGVDGWLQRQREAAVAAQSLELVRADLVQLMEQADELADHNSRVLEAVQLVWSAAGTPGLIEKDPATYEALSLMLWRRTVRFPRAAYDELVATGNLRALEDPDLRATLVRFYAGLARDEEVILRNNEAFTDGFMGGLLIGDGLLISLPTTERDFAMDVQAPTAVIRAQYLPVGPTYGGRIWDLPAGHPDRVRLLSAVSALSLPAAGHLIHAQEAHAGAAELIGRIDASLGIEDPAIN